MFALLTANPLASISAIALAVALAFGGFEYVHSASLSSEVATQKAANAQLTLEKNTLTASVNTLNFQIDQTKAAQDTLEQTIAELSAKQGVEDKTLKDIDNAPASDDGSVAPVLRHAFDGLRNNP